jgi:trk system potassium uptake protein
MNLYDAVVHAFSTVATGGFSSKTASIGFYDSLAIEAVLIVFMILSGVSFSLYYLLYARRRFDAVLDRELLTYVAIILGTALFVWGVLVFEGAYGDYWGRALRDSAFSVTSIMTTTGFVTADFDQWNTAAQVALVLLMFIGGCAGSTAGGLKVIRIIVIFHTNFQEIFRMVHPRAVTPLKIGGRLVPEKVRAAVLALFAAWITVFALATVLVALQQDLTLVSAATAVATTLNCVGPGASPSWGFGKFRGGQRLRTFSADGLHAAREVGDIHRPGAALSCILETLRDLARRISENRHYRQLAEQGHKKAGTFPGS